VNLRRVRVRLTAVYAVSSAIAVGVLAFLAVQAGTQRLREQAVADLRSEVGSVLGHFDPNALPTDQFDTWAYDIESQTAKPLGQTDVEPPFHNIVQAAQDGGGSATDRFAQGNTRYIVVAQRVPNTPLMLVAVADVSGSTTNIHRLRWRVGLAAVAVVLFTTIAAYVLSGLSLRPARQAGDQQRRFLADAAHQLRTPIALIQAAAGQALHRSRSPEEYVLALTEIRAGAERAGDAVAQLLDLARLEAGETALRRAPLRLDLLAEEVAAAVSTGASPSAVSVSVDAPAPVVVNADYGLLRQALDNVVRNGVGRAAHVVVRVTSAGRTAEVEVADDGPGFDPTFLPHAFDRFQRGDDGRGTGLGLALVRHVVEVHGGRVEAANQDGGGAVVRWWVPVGEGGSTN
jgi:signal transduction histidine kinase